MKAAREAARRRLETAARRARACCSCTTRSFRRRRPASPARPFPDSWWGHAKGKLIYETLEQVGETVAWAKLVLGKDTLVHRRLWPALVAAAESRQAWQTRGLAADAKRLLARVRRGRPIRTDEAPAGKGRKLGRRRDGAGTPAARPGTSEHTASGHHARFLETWAAWGGARGIGAPDLPERPRRSPRCRRPSSPGRRTGSPRALLPWYEGG